MEQRATVDGTTVRYQDAGAGEVLVLLHAFPLASDMWHPQLAAVPEGWRIIAPDLPGFGPSAREGAYGPSTVFAREIDDYAHHVLALLDVLGTGRVAVGGLSMGGYVAFALLRLAPERLRGLLLADTRPEADPPEARAGRLDMLAALEASGPRAIADRMLPKLLGESTRRERPDIVDFVRRTIERQPPAGIADAIRCLRSRPDSTLLLPGIEMPVQLVVGRDDELTPVAVHEQMQAQIPGAALTVIEGAGHLSNLERPDVFTRAMSRFLQSLS